MSLPGSVDRNGNQRFGATITASPLPSREGGSKRPTARPPIPLGSSLPSRERRSKLLPVVSPGATACRSLHGSVDRNSAERPDRRGQADVSRSSPSRSLHGSAGKRPISRRFSPRFDHAITCDANKWSILHLAPYTPRVFPFPKIPPRHARGRNKKGR
jgi:hypothetical protein